MILLDTNVVSEALRPDPNTKVISWLDEQIWETLYLSAITVAELRMGAAVLPDGRKRICWLIVWKTEYFRYLKGGFCLLTSRRRRFMHKYVRPHANRAKRLPLQTAILRLRQNCTKWLWQRGTFLLSLQQV